MRSNVSDWAAEDLWKASIQLTEAEAAFRIPKDEWRLRPVWHQTAERVRVYASSMLFAASTLAR